MELLAKELAALDKSCDPDPLRRLVVRNPIEEFGEVRQCCFEVGVVFVFPLPELKEGNVLRDELAVGKVP